MHEKKKDLKKFLFLFRFYFIFFIVFVVVLRHTVCYKKNTRKTKKIYFSNWDSVSDRERQKKNVKNKNFLQTLTRHRERESEFRLKRVKNCFSEKKITKLY